MSLASVVITSIVFAFLQYSEIATKDRVEDAKKLLKNLNVYDELRAGPEGDDARQRYDTLINYEIRRMPWLKGLLYALLVVLTFLHLAAAHLDTFQADAREAFYATVALSWWPVIVMVIAAGIRMSWAAMMVRTFRRNVLIFRVFLEGWRAGRNH